MLPEAFSGVSASTAHRAIHASAAAQEAWRRLFKALKSRRASCRESIQQAMKEILNHHMPSGAIKNWAWVRDASFALISSYQTYSKTISGKNRRAHNRRRGLAAGLGHFGVSIRRRHGGRWYRRREVAFWVLSRSMPSQS